MSLTISGEGSADNLPKLAKGTYLGTCFRIVDLGTSDQEYKGEVNKKTRVHISFEITKALDPDNNEVNMEDGRPFAVSKTYTASLYKQATLFKDLENWRNKSFTDEELKGFDIVNLLGCTARIEVGHTEPSGDFPGGNPKIQRLSSPDGGIVKVETINKMEAFDLSVYCEEWRGHSSEATKAMCDIFENLPTWQQEDIEKSYELRAAKESEPETTKDEGSDSLSNLADNKEDKSEPDIPF